MKSSYNGRTATGRNMELRKDFCFKMGLLSILQCTQTGRRQTDKERQKPNRRVAELSLELGTPAHESDAKTGLYETNEPE